MVKEKRERYPSLVYSICHMLYSFVKSELNLLFLRTDTDANRGGVKSLNRRILLKSYNHK